MRHERETDPDGHLAQIEVGWILFEELSGPDLRAAEEARDRFLSRLRRTFPGFEWSVPIRRLRDSSADRVVEPVELLETGLLEREAHHWDFAVVVTRADLRSHYGQQTFGVPSSAIGVAVASLARLGDLDADPAAVGRRLAALALHLFGDLNDLPHCGDADRFMFRPRSAEDLDRMSGFHNDEAGRLVRELEAVADLRLEERSEAPQARLGFVVRALWIGRTDVLSAVVQAAPWQFPFRFSRLSTGAVSAVLVLMMTAEAWDLGMSRAPVTVMLLSVLVLAATSAFVAHRQRLLRPPGATRLTEQRVVMQASIVLVVVLGMLTTYLGLFGLVLLFGEGLFSRQLVSGWATSLDGDVTLRHLARMAGVSAALGLVIGALGASFEAHSYFRHITYVDEET